MGNGLAGGRAGGFTLGWQGWVSGEGRQNQNQPLQTKPNKQKRRIFSISSVSWEGSCFPGTHFKLAAAFCFQRSCYSLPSSVTAVFCSRGQDAYYSPISVKQRVKVSLDKYAKIYVSSKCGNFFFFSLCNEYFRKRGIPDQVHNLRFPVSSCSADSRTLCFHLSQSLNFSNVSKPSPLRRLSSSPRWTTEAGFAALLPAQRGPSPQVWEGEVGPCTSRADGHFVIKW